MYLVGLTVSNWRPFARAAISLPRTGLVLITGANNAGKSALLLGFDVLAGRSPSGLTRVRGDGPARITGRFELDDAERWELFADFRYGGAWHAAGALVDLVVTFEEVDGMVRLVEASCALPYGRRFEILTVHHAGAPPAAHLHNWEWFRAANPANFSPQAEIPWTRGNWPANFDVTSLLDVLGRPFAEWGERLFHFQAVRPGTETTRTLAFDAKLATDGRNLPEVLLAMRTNEAQRFAELREALRNAIPGAGELVVRTGTGNRVWVAMHDDQLGTDINLKEVGSGVEQLLLAAVVGISHPSPSVTVLEEPEAGLHPGAQRELARLLRTWGKRHLIVASTHSPVLIELDSDEARTHTVMRRASVSEVAAGPQRPAEVLAALGVRLSDILSAERLLLVEGVSDQLVIRAWFADLLDENHVGVVALGGGDRTWDLPTVTDVIEAAGHLSQPIALLRDRDELTSAQIAKMESLGGIHVLSCRELENLLLDPDTITAVLRAHQHEAVAAVTEQELRKTADLLRPTVLLKRVAAHFPPVRLLDRATVGDLAKSGAELAAVETTVVSAIPDRAELQERVREVWREQHELLVSEWDERALQLAPGEELLAHVFAARGRRFAKRRDAVRLAGAMQRPPDEVRAVIERLIQSSST